MIRTPDQRLRVFVSSTLGELADERMAVRRALGRLRVSPVMFELGARPHPPRELYRAYLEQSHVFLGIYWQRYGWTAPGEEVSGLEDEYRLAGRLPQLVYIKEPAPDREPELARLLDDIRDGDRTSYRRFSTLAELEELVCDDLALLLSERFEAAAVRGDPEGSVSPTVAPLPVPLTPIFGRKDEIALIVRMVDQGERCVTVTGPGGVGKTRVALEAARVLAERRGGLPVRYVALATVSSPGLAIATMAEALGVRGATTRGPLEAMVEHFHAEQCVLVLDNLEQVIGVRTPLAELLERAPSVHVVATSRQPLRMRGEREVVMSSLALPAAGSGLVDVARSPAVELFLDRARALGRPFELDEQNAADVAALCRRLDGLPLALELAAARLRVMTARTLLNRLRSALDLSAGASDVPDRQRTIRATLDWSYNLLEERERSLLRRLSVFAGGATLAAIEDVCGVDDALLETLASLLDKSLLVGGPLPEGGEPRLRMPDPVRDYAGELLAENGERSDVRRRHLRYFGQLGREAQPSLCGPGQREWVTRLDAERANVREAVEAGIDLGEPDTALRLIWDTLVYFYVRDAVDECRDWLVRLAARRTEFDDVGRALLDVGLVIVGEHPGCGNVAAALAGAERVFATQGLALEAAVTLHHLGLQNWYDGEPVAAVEALEGSSERFAAIDHDWGVATVEMTLGAVRAAGGHRGRSTAHYVRSLEHSRRIDNRPQMAQGLQGLALVRALTGRLEEAWDALAEAAAIVRDIRSVTGVSYCLEALAAVETVGANHEAAARCLGAAREVRRRLAVPEWTAAADVAVPVAVSVRAAIGSDRFSALSEEGAADDPFALLEFGVRAVGRAGREPTSQHPPPHALQ